MKRCFVVVYALCLSVMACAQHVLSASLEEAQPDRLADGFVKAGLVVAEPGDELYGVLGHVCLHLQCPYYGLDYVFSYESEAVRGRVLRFLLNDLKMGMFPLALDDYLAPYREEGRGVKEYPLNLPPEVELRLWQVLDEKVMEGQGLPYDYIKRGCAISVWHVLREALGDTPVELPAWEQAFERTLREMYYDNSPEGWQRFYAMTLVGGDVDNCSLPKEEKLIIPCELIAFLQHTMIRRQPVVGEEFVELLPAVNQNKGDRFTPLHASLLLLLLALGSLLWQRPYIDWAILALQTAFGMLMTWLLFSPLPGTEWSWLIVPFNPLPLLFWKWRKWWALPYVGILLLWIIGVLCAPHRLVENAHIIMVLAFMVVLLKPILRKQVLKIENQGILY